MASAAFPSQPRFPSLAARWAALCIGLYQRYVSPYKGFRCAHRALHQGESCSQHVKRLVLERGLRAALPGARERFRDCRTAKEALLRMAAAGPASEDQSRRQAAAQSAACVPVVCLPVDCCSVVPDKDCTPEGCDAGGCDIPDVGCCGG